jgi:hypothetical protein
MTEEILSLGMSFFLIMLLGLSDNLFLLLKIIIAVHIYRINLYGTIVPFDPHTLRTSMIYYKPHEYFQFNLFT